VLNLLQEGPRGIKDIAAKLKMSPFTVRYHLSTLEQIGLISKNEVRRKKRGRPESVYGLSSRPVLLTFPRRRYDELTSSLLSAMGKTMSEESFKTALWKIGREKGLRLLSEVGQKHQVHEWTLRNFRLYFLDGALKEVVGSLGITKESADTLIFRIYNCPLRELAEQHPRLFCEAMEEGFEDGLTEATKGRFRVKKLKSMTRGDPHCEFEVVVA